MTAVAVDRVRWAWNAAFSCGVGYEAQPLGSAFELDSVAGYFIDFRAKTLSPSASTPAALGPAGLAQLALGWWERSLDGEDALESFRQTCLLLEARGVAEKSGLWFPYDVAVPKYGLVAPWYSALAQGQAASVFVRLANVTGEERHAELAKAALQPLLDDASPLVVVTEHGRVLEEAPSEPPSLILNGWIYGLWGLWDVAVGLGDRRSRDSFHDGLQCLLRLLPHYDVGWWSRYSLFPHRLVDLAKPFYHRLHVDQLEALYRLTGLDILGRTSRRWDRYDSPVARSRALVQKAGFVAARALAA